MRKGFLLVAAVVSSILLFFSFTYFVYGSSSAICTVPSGYATLQSAVDDTNCSTINVDAGTFNEYVTIDRDVVIAGSSSGTTVFDGQDAGRPFTIDNAAANVTLRDLSIESGQADIGGAILNHGLLHLDNLFLSANSSTEDGGAVYSTNDLSIVDSYFQVNDATEEGGAIYLDGAALDYKQLDITNTTFWLNSAGISGGGMYVLYAHTNLTDTYWDNNSAGTGGGITDLCGNLTMIGGSAVNHSVTGLGGFYYGGCGSEDDVTTIRNVSIMQNQSDVDGGAIYRSGNMEIHNSSFTSNIADNHGGAIYTKEGGIYYSDFTYNYGDLGAAIYVEGGTGETIIDNSRISYNTIDTEYRGAIHSGSGVSMTVRHSEINNNEGAGLYNGGTLTVYDTQIMTNTRGIYNATEVYPTLITRSTIAGNILALPTNHHDGGGIRNWGPLTVQHSTINNNWALDNGGGISSNGPITLTNVTLSSNVAYESGGGIWHNNDDPAIFNNLTVYENIAGGDPADDGNGGGIFIYDDVTPDTVVIKNSIIAENDDSRTPDGIHDDCSGPIDTLTYTLIGMDVGCTLPGGAGNIVGTFASPETANLKVLADKGGATFTHEPKSGSQALDAGFCTSVGRDQRGVVRVVGVAGCDIGAFEDGTCPAPAIPEVDISLAYGNAELQWTKDPDTQRMFKINHSNAPYLDPIPVLIKRTLGEYYSYSSVVGSGTTNHYFSVRAANACGDNSDRDAVGVFHFSMEPGS